MPKYVIYDNACHADAYCMTRSPHEFYSVQWLIDKFHSNNHVFCSHCYLIKTYADALPGGDYDSFKSSASESHHSVMDKCIYLVRYAGMDNALNVVAAFADVVNGRVQQEPRNVRQRL